MRNQIRSPTGADGGQTARKASAAGTPSAAHRTKYLLSGFLTCACCGRPYTIQAGGKYYCRNRKQCGNRTPISRAQIEARVFARLRHMFLAPDLVTRFDKALADERRRLEGDDGKDVLKALTRRKAAAEKGLKVIVHQIEQGKVFDALFSRASDLETEIEDLARQIAAHQAAQTEATSVPLSSEQIYTEAIARLEHALSDPDVVHAAHEHLATLIRKITLTPDPDAPDGIAAEIHLDLGSLLSGAGYSEDIARRFANNPQMTAEFEAAPRPSPAGLRGRGPARSRGRTDTCPSEISSSARCR